jgi:hypothetical protein
MVPWSSCSASARPAPSIPATGNSPAARSSPAKPPHAALVRELGEELGIGVTRADPWLRREHVYEHAHVRLNFFRVRDWCGELHDHVHSALAWQRADALTVSPMLPANAPVLAALALPDFYAISHAGEIGIDAQLLALARALEAGLRLVQLREPALDGARRAAFVHAAVDLCHQYGARVLVNGDTGLAQAAGADGVHLPARIWRRWNGGRIFRWSRRPAIPLRNWTGRRRWAAISRCSARCGRRPAIRVRRHRLGRIGGRARRAATADFCPGRPVACRPRCRATRRRPRHRGDSRRLGIRACSQSSAGLIENTPIPPIRRVWVRRAPPRGTGPVAQAPRSSPLQRAEQNGRCLFSATHSTALPQAGQLTMRGDAGLTACTVVQSECAGAMR